MKHLWLAGVVSVALPAMGQGPPPACDPLAPLDDMAVVLDHIVQVQVTRGFAGMVLVERDDRMVFCRGYGWTDSSRQFAITPHTQFFVASVTKQFTAAAVLRLSEQGRLSLHDSLGRFLPGLPARARRVTLHQLLTHTAGLQQNYLADGHVDRDSAMAAIYGEATSLDSTGAFNYTNDAYATLAAVIEVAAGEGWESFVARELLRPAGMTTAGFWGMFNDRDVERVAQKQMEQTGAMAGPNWGYRGSSGIWANALELYRWYQTAWRGGLLQPANRDLLFTPHITLASGLGIGYGSFRTPHPGGAELWVRGQEDFGHNAVLRWFPAQRVFVMVLSNGGEIEGTGANRVVSDAIVTALVGDL